MWSRINGLLRVLLLVGVLGVLLPAAAGAAIPHTRDLASQANITIKGAAAADKSGTTVASAGDVNGDGRDDIAVDAYEADNQSRTDAGSVYVIFGRATPADVDLALLTASQGYRIDGPSVGAGLGYRVRNGGDFNGDGKDDLLIAASNANAGGRSYNGAEYVIYGKTSGTTIDTASLGSQGISIVGPANDQNVGEAADVGDVNGDGIKDLLVASWGLDFPGRTDAGGAYVVFGSSMPTNVDLASLGSGGFKVEGPVGGDVTGDAITYLGDLNADGNGDFAIGSPYTNGVGADAGAVYVVFGKTTTSTVDLAALGAGGYEIDGANGGAEAGEYLDAVPDMNGDGRKELLIGSRGATFSGRTGAGTVDVVYGKATTSTVSLASLGSAGYTIGGTNVNDGLGDAVASLGDINGDGITDLAVTASSPMFAGRANAGAVYVIYGRTGAPANIDTASLGLQGYVIGGAQTASRTGTNAAADAGDLNGDGRDDIIVGAALADPGVGSAAGASYVVYSDATAPVSALSVTATARSDLQYYSSAAHQLFYNPVATGSFTLSDSAFDVGSGTISASFPGVGMTGFNGSAQQAATSPWQSGTYTFGVTNAVSPGAQSVVLQDGQGNRTVAPFAFTRDVAAPAGTVTAASTLAEGDDVTAIAPDAGSGTASVEFRFCPGATCAWASGTPIGSPDTAAPFSLAWSSQPADGQYTLVARSTDRVANVGDATKTVTVSNPPPPPTPPPHGSTTKPIVVPPLVQTPSLPPHAKDSNAKPVKRPLSILTRSVRVSRKGIAPVKVSCSTSRRCRGTVALFYYVSVRRHKGHSHASAAAKVRRRKVVIGRGKFSLRAGDKTTIKVHISRKGRRHILRKRNRRCHISTVANGRRTTTSITVKPPLIRR